MSTTVLLFETEASLRKVVAASLEQQGFDIIQAANADAVRMHLRRDTPDLFVLELDHPDGDNGRLIDAYRSRSNNGAVLLTTTERPDNGWRDRYQPEAVVYKPFDVRFLCRRVRGLAEMTGAGIDTEEGAANDADGQ
jgi:DNA-binding response OmpR family regulator